MSTEIGFWLLVLTFIAALIGSWWLFHSNRLNPPTLFERIVATGWLLIRRVVCFAGALLCFVGAVMLAFTSAAQIDTFIRLGYALFMFLVSVFCVWAAIYGQGQLRGDWKDDVALHHKTKSAMAGGGNEMPNPSVKFVPAFGLHGTRRKRRAPYLERWAS